MISHYVNKTAMSVCDILDEIEKELNRLTSLINAGDKHLIPIFWDKYKEYQMTIIELHKATKK